MVQSQLFGRPLLKLPTPHEEVFEVQFNAQERIMSDFLEQRFIDLEQEEYPKGHLRNKFKNGLHQLIRLRQ